MSPSFNLLNKPFLPVYTASGRKECSIKEALAQAPQIIELRDASPLVTLALHRLLLAILHRNFGPQNLKQWATLWQKGCFDQTVLDEYFKQWETRFDLFDAKRPFYQDATWQSSESKGSKGINGLVREMSRGNNAMLFDHTGENPPPLLEPAAVARALIAEQAFAVGGGKSERGYTTHAPLIGGVAVLVQGNNLFETLLLNLVKPNEVMPGNECDVPIWERNEQPIEADETPTGYLDYLTWQSRSIYLYPETDGHVQWMSYAQGRKFEPPDNTPVYDPMMAYDRAEKGDKPIRLSETKALWRESAAIFARTKAFRPPATLRQLGQLLDEGHLPSHHMFTLSAIGLCTDKAKVNFWRHETFPLPRAYLTSTELGKSLGKSLGDALNLAEKVGSAVRQATRKTAELLLTRGQRSLSEKHLHDTIQAIGADAFYWSRLEEPFRRLLVNLLGDLDHQKRQIDQWFRQVLYGTACQAFEQTAGHFDYNGHAQRAFVAGDQCLRGELAKIAKQNNIAATVSQGSLT